MDASARGQRTAGTPPPRPFPGSAGRVSWPAESWLSLVERGPRLVDRHSVLVPLADIHHVGISELTGDEPGDPRASHDAAFRRFEQAMAFDALESVIGADDDVHAPDLARLWLDVEDPARPAGQMHPPSSYRLATRASAG